MTGSLQVKNGYLYAVISYKSEVGDKKVKWISTGLKERGNKKAAKAILDQKIVEFDQSLMQAKNKIERRSKSKEVNKNDATMLYSDYCVKYVESIKNTLSPTAYHNYSEHYPKVIRAYFDKNKIRVIDVTAEDIQGFYDYL